MSVIRTRPIALILALALPFGCATERRSVSEEVRSLVDHAEFEAAVKISAEAAARKPNDASLQELHRDASVAYLLEQGRRKTFDDQDEDALELFDRALTLNPDSKTAQSWRQKTTVKLSERWLHAALELHAKDEIDGALAAYETSLAYLPADKDSLTGRDLCVAILEHRAALGRSYFDDGLHALAAYWLQQARSRFSYSRKYRPEDTHTAQREEEVELLLAIERLSMGRRAESERQYGAALSEYRRALVLDPDSRDAAEGVERMRAEIEVTGLLARASMDIVRGKYDRATTLVEEAASKTKLQGDLCAGKFDAIREARLEKAYRAALALERDNRYDEAVAAYAELLKKAEFYKDVITRKDTLEEYLALANDLYARSQAASDPTEKLQLLQQIRVFWPGYKDIAGQIRALSQTPSDS
ncbi:MAG: hypothetical protein JNL28_11270 [Planctomycetes bacterium]|nr:hypothetical protein [Planctomycetota bacterium]